LSAFGPNRLIDQHLPAMELRTQESKIRDQEADCQKQQINLKLRMIDKYQENGNDRWLEKL